VTDSAARPLILFDGMCNLCAGSVRFVIARDPKARFTFASLQSEYAKDLLGRLAPGAELPDSIVLIEGGVVRTQSTAALRVARRLRLPWPLLYGFIVVPAFLRNAVYRWIARNRYRWFGKQQTCMVPSQELRSRFLG